MIFPFEAHFYKVCCTVSSTNKRRTKERHYCVFYRAHQTYHVKHRIFSKRPFCDTNKPRICCIVIPSGSSLLLRFVLLRLHWTIYHYNTLHYISLNCTTSNYTGLLLTKQNCFSLHCTKSYYSALILLLCTKSYNTALHLPALHFHAMHYISLHCT